MMHRVVECKLNSGSRAQVALEARYSERESGKIPGRSQGDPWDADVRTRAMHDRDRVLYSSAFQRLAYVTQVTAPESGITFHNRLSHSLKVAQIGRRNAERLLQLADTGVIVGASAQLVGSLSPEAVEAACLAHDLGHPPFGHIAEEVLQDCAAESNVPERFEGNAQSFRIVTRLAQRASGQGLDLTRQTLDGLLKYPWRHWSTGDTKKTRKWGYYDDDADVFQWVRHDPPTERVHDLPFQSLEAAIMEWADDITYAVHDIDDFYRAGLIPLDRLGEDSDEMKALVELFREADAEDPGSLGAEPSALMEIAQSFLPSLVPNGPYRHTWEDRRDMKLRASGLITRYLSAFRIEDAPDGEPMVRVSEATEREVTLLKALVRVYVIRRPGLAVVQHGQKRVIQDLFRFYLQASRKERGDLRLFPPAQRALLKADGHSNEKQVRLVIDLIAGLTEQSAIALHQRLAGGGTAATLDATAAMA